MAWNLEEALIFYKKQGAPADQNSLITLLREVQQENGGTIPIALLSPIAEGLGTQESLLLALARRIPRLQLSGQHTLELCSGPACGKSAALAACAEAFCRKYPDKISLRFVPCMRMCSKSPNLRWDGKLYHRADESLLKKLLENI